MGYPEYNKAGLAAYSGRPALSYTAYADTAISQALLLFKIGTCLASLDDLDDDQKQLASMAIYAMADSIYIAQPYQKAVASPFSSESIGSYSYSKTAKAVSKGDETGIMWFDLAMDQLSVCGLNDDGIPNGGGIEMFEHQGVFSEGRGNNVRYLGPEDIELSRVLGFDPSSNGLYGG